MKKFILMYSALMLLFALSACTSSSSSGQGPYGGYKGSGGMAAYAIKPEVYAYHYDNGFTGSDAMGWDPNLQYAWSRTGAARVCGVNADEAKIVKQMVATYEQDELVHKLNGIDFHYAQIQSTGVNFCTPERVEELKTVIPHLEAGKFPKKY